MLLSLPINVLLKAYCVSAAGHYSPAGGGLGNFRGVMKKILPQMGGGQNFIYESMGVGGGSQI